MIEKEQLTIQAVFAMAAEKGLKPRPWMWKRLLDYNNFPHEVRVTKFIAMDLACRLGLIPPATDFPCDICGTTASESKIGYHSEDYSSMSGHYPICNSCHSILHRRFYNRKTWLELISKYGDCSKWFEHLT